MYILFTDRKERTNRDYKTRGAIETVINVVDNVKYVAVNVLVIIELLVMVVMIHLIFVHDDELLDLI
jgi:hypothetical protein